MIHRLRSTIGFLVSAAMLTGSLIPPGYGHAHAKGEIPHEHRQAPDIEHGYAHSGRHRHSHGHHSHGHHRHSHGHHSHGHRHDAKDREFYRTLSINPAAVAHVHLTFFWFDFTLPASNPTDPEGPQPKTPLLFYSTSLMDEAIAPSDDDGANQRFCTLQMAPESVDSLLPEQPVMRDAPQGHSHRCLLCDTARHERSGVQLF